MFLHRSDVLIDSRLIAYRRGGISRYVASLLDWLPRVAPDLDIHPFVNRRTTMALTAARVMTPPHHRFERLSLGAELTVRRPKLIHSTDFVSPHTVGAKRIATIHDLNFVVHPEQLDPASLRYYEQIHASIGDLDQVIAVSRYTSERLQDLLGVSEDRITVIPNGVEPTDAPVSENGVTNSLGPSIAELLQSDRPFILMVGTIEPRKRHALMLDALEKMRERPDARDVQLIIVGQRGWNCAELVQGIQRETSAGRVIWLESADDELLAYLYQQVSIVVVPSLDEGFGLPALEAMAAGTPVVAAKRGAMPEVVGDAGLLIDDDDPEAWASALVNLVNDTDTRDVMAERGIERTKQFTWERTARMTAELYRQTIAS